MPDRMRNTILDEIRLVTELMRDLPYDERAQAVNAILEKYAVPTARPVAPNEEAQTDDQL